jgi:hypothetical protein
MNGTNTRPAAKDITCIIEIKSPKIIINLIVNYSRKTFLYGA